MLNVEQSERRSKQAEPLSYSSYLRVPEMLQLQSPLAEPPARDEMLFIIVQQVQELWFKQMLHDLRYVIEALEEKRIPEALPLLDRINRIWKLLAQEVAVLGMMPPQEFHRFRHVLSPASGFESVQFRELEHASGLNTPTFKKLLEKHLALTYLEVKWPKTLHDCLLELLEPVSADPVDALVEVYNNSRAHPELYILAEALSEYEVLVSEWRFHHIKLVERAIGDSSPGTGGSSGAGYLAKTLGYRFFPELWELRNRLTAGVPRPEEKIPDRSDL